ncbi:MAG TPA: multicopper oxidase domain-containing protein, partial [Dissulfurispiraceae bacterium]|nr:multicopper oxidase domain-containing protein [Dissulfurispiraceae bacterium]
QRGGTDQVFTNSQGLPTFGQGYMDSITEVVSAGAVQVWDFYNTTMDTHPWHFHLVNVQIVGRGICATDSQGLPIFGSFTDLSGIPGQLTPPNPNELGWKETVRMNPGEITRVIMRFDLPKIPKTMGTPLSPRTGGHEYVHHCHILEHEEHDMMRVLKVI